MIVVSAGAYRSGSTWMWRAIREVCRLDGPTFAKFICGAERPKGATIKHWVFKTHAPQQGDWRRADYIFYCYRDLRNVVGSAIHYGICKPRDIQTWVRHYLERDKFWRKCASCSFRYETMIHNREWAAEQISHIVGIHLNAEQLRRVVFEASESKDEERRQGHRALGGGNHWKTSLRREQLQAVMECGGDWLRRNGY
jgi:hypothetical protein